MKRLVSEQGKKNAKKQSAFPPRHASWQGFRLSAAPLQPTACPSEGGDEGRPQPTRGTQRALHKLMVPTSAAGITIPVAAAAASWLTPELINFLGPTVKSIF